MSAESVRAAVVVVARPSGWREAMVACFAENGFAVVEYPTGARAFDHRAHNAVAAIMELDLCGGVASEVLDAWRTGSPAPIFAVGDTRDEAAVLAAYAAGADHVAPLDVSPRQLLARVRSVLRHRVVPRPNSEPAIDSPVRLDAERLVAVVDEMEVALTPAEFDVLALLVARGGRLLTRVELRSMVHDLGPSERAVDFFVRRLRAKVEQVDGIRRILVVRGVGFRFEAAAAPCQRGEERGAQAAI